MVQELNSKAKHYYNNLGDHREALEMYFKALEICNSNKLTEKSASIHGNCAHLLLQVKSYHEAYTHADACIELYPSNDQVHMYKFDLYKVNSAYCRVSKDNYNIYTTYHDTSRHTDVPLILWSCQQSKAGLIYKCALLYTCMQAYIWRAEALKRCLQSGIYHASADLNYGNVITDYCRAHDLKTNIKAFVDAILVAIDNGKNRTFSNLTI